MRRPSTAAAIAFAHRPAPHTQLPAAAAPGPSLLSNLVASADRPSCVEWLKHMPQHVSTAAVLVLWGLRPAGWWFDADTL